MVSQSGAFCFAFYLQARRFCSTGMSGAFAALRGFRRRWADPEPGPESALASAPQLENALLSVTPDSASRSNGSFCLWSQRERRLLHLVQWVPYLLLILLGSSLATACRWANLSCGVHLSMAASGRLSGAGRWRGSRGCRTLL